MREGEIIGAKAEWLNLTEKTLTVHHSKIGDYRVVPFPPSRVGKLKTYIDATGLSLGLLFPGRKGKQHCRSCSVPPIVGQVRGLFRLRDWG
jgi:integrase